MFTMKIDLSEKGLKQNIYYCACFLIGGEENTIEDYGEDSEEGKRAKAWLSDRQRIIKDIFISGCTTVYGEGFEGVPNDDKLVKAYMKLPPKLIKQWVVEAIDELL